MDEEDLGTTNEIDEVFEWMINVLSDKSSPSPQSSTGNNLPTLDLRQYEIGMTRNQINYVTDGKKWKWFD